MKAKQKDETTLGRFIQNRREELGISLRELARRVKASSSLISWVERDKGFPSKAVAGRIAEVFKVPIGELSKFDDRVPIGRLQRTIERNPSLRAAMRLMVREIESGDISAEHFARAIHEVADSSRASSRKT